jgi:hypothetical protein
MCLKRSYEDEGADSRERGKVVGRVVALAYVFAITTVPRIGQTWLEFAVDRGQTVNNDAGVLPVSGSRGTAVRPIGGLAVLHAEEHT